MRLAAVGVLSLWLPSCAERSQPAAQRIESAEPCNAPAQPMVRSELVFGMSRPDGSSVSEAEWAEFLQNEVTPRFPAGLTVLSGLGQWQGDDGRLTREASKIVLILHDRADRTEADIEAIRAAYQRRFDQDSVMRVESVSCVSF